MKIAVTGCLGHIGSRLIHDLRANHFSDVLLVDDLSTQRYPSLFALPGDVPFRFVQADVCSDDLVTLFRGIDAVIHLAALTDAAGTVDMADEVHRVNFHGTERVARACIQNGARLLFPSTTSVYGSS